MLIVQRISVPFGGGKGAKQQWIEFEYHNLDRFTEIWLSLDADEVGREAAKEIANRLGEYRCRLVSLPKKDINECLQAGITQEEIIKYLETATYFDPDELCSAREFMQDTIQAFYGKEQYLFRSPWETLNHQFSFRESELTILNGVNGHGKSEILGHMLCEAMRQGARACVASFELKPAIFLKRLEKGSFTSYNKVADPYKATVQLSKSSGGTLERGAFLAQLEILAKSTLKFYIITPEYVYKSANIVGFDFAREARDGATLIKVNVHLEEIREVSVQYEEEEVTNPDDSRVKDAGNKTRSTGFGKVGESLGETMSDVKDAFSGDGSFLSKLGGAADALANGMKNVYGAASEAIDGIDMSVNQMIGGQQ
ncbi:hypothetical protein OO7_10807 [Providencia sneebia DSM 19967]|uniref:DNA primase n=1 Tax=Providencia sneebia DSM 19967 TaxID=1141660 RepID=K8W741_9GAMM|nr:hypothetical protein OO7_10807 [Providencia sneebia DSM 19967]